MELSRLLITGELNMNTPMCVIKEIADAHGIKYDQMENNTLTLQYKLIELINSTKVEKIIIIKDSLRDIARYINKDISWPKSKLLLAFNFLNQFNIVDDPLRILPKNFKIGLQTPENIESINSCILYRICVLHKINLNNQTSIEEMEFSIKMLKETPETLLEKVRIFINSNIENHHLINILLLSNQKISITEESEISYNILENIHKSLTDIRYLQKSINPSSNQGAIALSAINYDIDISKSSVPIDEYKMLKLIGRTDYIPIDKYMQYWYKTNPSIFDLTVYFNPLFPSVYYNNNDLINMVINQGYKEEDLINDQPYELLQLSHVSETFYYGELPNLRIKETPILILDIKEVPYGQLLCYGSLNTFTKPISIEELIELFNNNENFSDPFSTSTVIPQLAINKLKLMMCCHIGHIPNLLLSEETINLRKKLYDVIINIENLYKYKDNATRQLRSIYKNTDPETKNMIKKSLLNLLFVGMYMRGWEGKEEEEFPVKTAYVPIEKTADVAMNVTNSINEYENTLRRLGRIGTQINNLPLVLYKDKEYHISNSDKEGLTIGDRIKIVKEGDSTSNTSSCIRLSSNWLCSSAHKYLTALDDPSPFDIFYLRHIS